MLESHRDWGVLLLRKHSIVSDREIFLLLAQNSHHIQVTTQQSILPNLPTRSVRSVAKIRLQRRLNNRQGMSCNCINIVMRDQSVVMYFPKLDKIWF